MWVPEEKKGLKYTEPESVCGKIFQIFQLLYERNDQNLSKFDKNLKNELALGSGEVFS